MKELTLIVSSSHDLELDRDVIHNVVRQLNNSLSKYGVSVKSFDDTDFESGKVPVTNMYIALFHKNTDARVSTNLQFADESFKKGKAPKIYIYFKDLVEGESLDDDLASFKDFICEKLEHYVNRYYSEDSIKFQVMLQVMNADVIDLQPRIQGESIMLGDEEIANINKMPFTYNNRQYKELTEDLHTNQKLLNDLREEFTISQNDEIWEKIVQTSAKTNELNQQVDNLKDWLLEIAIRFSKLESLVYSNRLSIAKRFFEDGDLESANKMLDETELSSELERNIHIYQIGSDVINEAKNNLLKILQEFRVKADVQQALAIEHHQKFASQYKEGENIPVELYERVHNRFIEEIKLANSYFRKAIDIARKIDLDKSQYIDLIFEYAKRIENLPDNKNEVIELYNELISLYGDVYSHNSQDGINKIIPILERLAYVFYRSADTENAHIYFNRAVDSACVLLNTNNPNKGSLIAVIERLSLVLGSIDIKLGKYQEAESMLNLSLTYSRSSFKEGSQLQYDHYPRSLDLLGQVHIIQKKYELAEKELLEALKVYETVKMLLTYNEYSGINSPHGILDDEDRNLRMVYIYTNLGVLASNRCISNDAMKHYLLALKTLSGISPTHQNWFLGPIDSGYQSIKTFIISCIKDTVIILIKDNETEPAITYLDEALSYANDYIRPGVGELFLLEGLLLSQKHEVQKSLTAFKEATLEMPNSALAHDYLGLAYYAIDDLNNANKEYNKVLSIDKDYYKHGDASLEKYLHDIR